VLCQIVCWYGCAAAGGDATGNPRLIDYSLGGSSAPDASMMVDAGTSGPIEIENGDGGVLSDAGSLVELDAADSTKPGACGASSFAAQQVTVSKQVQVTTQVTTTKPVVLYVMLDQSLSMSISNIWKPAVSAIESFTTDTKSKGVGIALQYFPLSGGSCSTGGGYVTPAVPVGLLPAQATKIASSLDGHSPSGLNTPIEGALRGVTDFCVQYQTDHPDQQCVSVLVTDGKPELASGCSQDHDKLAAIAGAAHAAGVTTFAVGLKGADFSLLDEIAMQGGAPDCEPKASTYACDVSSGADQLVTALASIRDTIVTTETHPVTVTETQESKLPCTWAIPSSPNGQMFDQNKVNIQLTSGDKMTTFVRVDSEAACRSDGWHFDDASKPTSLIACPAACAQIDAASDAKLDVLLGCATLLPE
jgi:hypothetical protein